MLNEVPLPLDDVVSCVPLNFPVVVTDEQVEVALDVFDVFPVNEWL